MEFTKEQENVFMIFDELIDSDRDLIDVISKSETLRKRIGRNFESVEGLSRTKSALHLYGMQGLLVGDSIIPKYELEKCFEISDEYEVVFDEDFANHLAIVYNKTYPEVKRFAFGEAKDTWELEALDKFVREHDDDFLSDYENIRRFTYLRTYYVKHFNNIKGFRSSFGIDSRLHPNHTRVGTLSAIQDGLYFEGLVEECFKATGLNVRTNYSVEDCRPDFVIDEESHWADAKLSKSTVFYAETIDKYTRHADHLTIIYALEDIRDSETPFLDDNVTLIHVLDFFEDLPPHLSMRIIDFIESVWDKRRTQV